MRVPVATGSRPDAWAIGAGGAMQKAARGRLFLRTGRTDYLVPLAAEAAGVAAAAAAAEAAASAAGAADGALAAASAAGAGAGAGAAAGAGAGAGAGSSFLPQAARAAAAIRVAKTSDFFISRFLLWDEAIFGNCQFGGMAGVDPNAGIRAPAVQHGIIGPKGLPPGKPLRDCPYGIPLTAQECWMETTANSAAAIPAGPRAASGGVPARCRNGHCSARGPAVA
jgi:hypothetical protein